MTYIYKMFSHDFTSKKTKTKKRKKNAMLPVSFPFRSISDRTEMTEIKFLILLLGSSLGASSLTLHLKLESITPHTTIPKHHAD